MLIGRIRKYKGLASVIIHTSNKTDNFTDDFNVDWHTKCIWGKLMFSIVHLSIK
jgi:hypothetical protein